MEFSVELATSDDDPAIRRLLATNPVPGSVTVTYEREPNYFLGCGTMGHFCQVGVARHRPSGQVVGVACRATRSLFVNGQVEEVGYLGQLRVDERFRGRWLASSAMRFLRQLHADGRVTGYLATITEGNLVASGILVHRPRRHFPTFREVDRLCTLAIILRGPKAVPRSPFDICRGSEEDLGAIVAYFRQHGAAKQFFPAYEEDDFRGNPITLGFPAEDFFLARRNGDVVGVIGLWDQSGYKQTVVQTYSGVLRWAKPSYNIGARLAGAQPLPSPGERIHFAYASFICAAENDSGIFRVLLRYVYNLTAERGYAYLMVGLAARDPLLTVAREYAHITYHSRLYTVCWKEGGQFHERLDDRIPYVEIAALWTISGKPPNRCCESFDRLRTAPCDSPWTRLRARLWTTLVTE